MNTELSPIGAVAVMCDRKASCFEGTETFEGNEFPVESFRPTLVGLDLDVTDVWVAAEVAASYVTELIADGRGEPLGALRTLAFDMFVAGVLFERERES